MIMTNLAISEIIESERFVEFGFGGIAFRLAVN